jgi:hypothetical protein
MLPPRPPQHLNAATTPLRTRTSECTEPLQQGKSEATLRTRVGLADASRALIGAHAPGPPEGRPSSSMASIPPKSKLPCACKPRRASHCDRTVLARRQALCPTGGTVWHCVVVETEGRHLPLPDWTADCCTMLWPPEWQARDNRPSRLLAAPPPSPRPNSDRDINTP